ncbi:MAG TPA: SRPBCC domain-containing protein [Bacteroidales bacterium]
MKDSLELSVILNETKENLYKAWLDSEQHSSFTGSPAQIDPALNGEFSAWDGYIRGTNKILEPYTKIVQAWRTTEFAENDEDSVIELLFETKGNKTQLTIKHYNIPEGQGSDYEQGWKEFYFKPMKKYYNRK